MNTDGYFLGIRVITLRHRSNKNMIFFVNTLLEKPAIIKPVQLYYLNPVDST